MIRKAFESDFDSIVELSREFWKHTMFEEPFEEEHTLKMVEMAREHGLLAVLEVDGSVEGFAAGVSSFLLASTQAKCGTELAWYLSPDHRGGKNGVALLQFMEQLAKEQGIKYWNMASMQSSMPDYVNRLYEKMGYTHSETTYTKVLSWQQSQAPS
jgi:GNAT superfamily N-acetyltransferase